MITLRDRAVLLAIFGLIGPLVMALNVEDKLTGKEHSFAHLVIDSNAVQLGEAFEVGCWWKQQKGWSRRTFPPWWISVPGL